ncbi:hypothetical protein PPL_08081 [Heterostelium album PN500]|uniref:Uncharacterized protein n=1 Tax=Heterostelium pallidum (strain ATCC 26659 / Pp 5 / PN500) TaxID=670386 RepID=D3BIK2_HETP5|nr:hypothetical protein PPL_08081 [Heterostelium album PN500]EFA78626.1 hypothetical protein PPL_08081 [Heterostelium album PN500]|eukprot:XP_020430750.1 hypothetical protein PPL_08081 [Heterostelium album PN500]
MGSIISKRGKNEKIKILILGYGFNGKSRFLQLANSVHPDALSMATTSEVQVSTLNRSNSDVSRVELDNLNYKFINIIEKFGSKESKPIDSLSSILLKNIKKESNVGVLLFFFGLNEYDHQCEDPYSQKDIPILNNNYKPNNNNHIKEIYNNNTTEESINSNKYIIVKNNRLRENIEFFRKIINQRQFKSTQVVVLLSGKEVFEDKLKSKPIKQYFPEYNRVNDPREAGAFISSLFTSADQSNTNRLAIHTFNPYDQEEIKNLIYFVQKKVES